MVDVKCISFSGYVSVNHKGLGLDVHKCGSLMIFHRSDSFLIFLCGLHAVLVHVSS